MLRETAAQLLRERDGVRGSGGPRQGAEGVVVTWGWVWKSAGALVIYFIVGGGLTVAGMAWFHLRTRGEESGVPELSCGCPNDSRPTYRCLWCDHERCGEHRGQHEHGAGQALTEQTCAVNAMGLLEVEVDCLRRNYVPMSEGDRHDLDFTFLSIVNPEGVPE